MLNYGQESGDAVEAALESYYLLIFFPVLLRDAGPDTSGG